MIFVFPYADQKSLSIKPLVTWSLVGLSVAVYIWQLLSAEGPILIRLLYTAGYNSTQLVALKPVSILLGITPDGSPVGGLSRWLPFLTSIFAHANLPHLLANMLYLWVFGGAIEERLGRILSPIFYLLGGIVATLVYLTVHGAINTSLLGGSGAIAAVLGAYTVYFPKAKVKVFLFFIAIIRFIRLPAWFFLLIWFFVLNQLLAGLTDETSFPIAWWAHIGGFCFGAIWAGLHRLYEKHYSAKTSPKPLQ